ncbi:GIY-YIG nuclease family protein [Flavobacteriales bacterium]|nr:GIY-YIG nuclease family protein [Flavobacteriales bacterium]
MVVYYVYILYSPSVKQYYIGETQDLPTRLLQHNDLICKTKFR